MNNLTARKNTINRQIRPWGGLNKTANQALMDIPRENFVPEKYKNLAFADIEIPLSAKAKMLLPKIEGRLLDMLDIKKHEIVLEIGTGSGYLTAVLAKLCKHVTSVDCDKHLSTNAQKKITALNINNIKLEVGDVVKDWSANNFFDIIVIGSAMPKISKNYLHILNIEGRIFVIEGNGNIMTAKLITRKTKNEWKYEALFETYLDIMLGLETKTTFKF